MARPRKPRALKVVEGTLRKDRDNPQAPGPPPGIPSAPAWLSRRAKAEWKRLAVELAELKIVAKVDRNALAALCDAVAELADANDVLEREGLFITTPQGFRQAHPAVSIRRNAREAVRKLSAVFGLTPADRSKVRVIPKLIHAANQRRRDGMTPLEAVYAAGLRRFRPILLTSLTTFFGLLPMIFEPSMQVRFLIPMAISLGFGVLFATMIVLLLVPALYLIIEDVRAGLGIASVPVESEEENERLLARGADT